MREKESCVAPVAEDGARPQPEANCAAKSSGVWIVMGSTGEWSDRSEWAVYAFGCERCAKDYVGLLSEKYREARNGADPGDYDTRDQVEATMRQYDPHFGEDYTGTRWWIREVAWAPKATLPTPEKHAYPVFTHDHQI